MDRRRTGARATPNGPARAINGRPIWAQPVRGQATDDDDCDNDDAAAAAAVGGGDSDSDNEGDGDGDDDDELSTQQLQLSNQKMFPKCFK